MRASMSSARGCENVSNVRTAGPPDHEGARDLEAAGGVAEEQPQDRDVGPVEAVVARGPLGIRRGEEGRQVGSVTVAALPSSNVVVIAFHGRQKSKWYLSFQQLIAASAPLRFCSASSLALSAASRLFRPMSCRATSFQLRTGALCHHLALYV